MIWSQAENLSCFLFLFLLMLYKGSFGVCKNHDKNKIAQKSYRIKEITSFFVIQVESGTVQLHLLHFDLLSKVRIPHLMEKVQMPEG